MFCGAVMTMDTKSPDPTKYRTWDDLVNDTRNLLYGAADNISNIAQSYTDSERHLLQRAQAESFPEEFNALKANELHYIAFS